MQKIKSLRNEFKGVAAAVKTLFDIRPGVKAIASAFMAPAQKPFRRGLMVAFAVAVSMDAVNMASMNKNDVAKADTCAAKLDQGQTCTSEEKGSLDLVGKKEGESLIAALVAFEGTALYYKRKKKTRLTPDSGT